MRSFVGLKFARFNPAARLQSKQTDAVNNQDNPNNNDSFQLMMG